MDEEKQIAETPVEVSEKKEVCFWKSVIGVFFEPTETFPILAEKKLWVLFPICLLFLSMFLSTYIFFERVDREAFMMEQFRKSKFSSQMSQEQIDKAVSDFKQKSSFAQSIMVPFFIIIWLVLASLVYYLSFLALGGLNTFIQTMLVVFWAELTTFLAQVIAIPIMMFKAPDELLNPQEILLTNLGAIIGSEKLSPALFSLLSSFDLFAILNLVLITLGLASISKLSKGFSALIVFSLYAAKIALKTAWVYFVIQ
ncbi:MAG: hypothetical protein GYA35_00330 [Thermoanaerobaculaceae bacterium]|nr:hypothetical protein [Thermoanaerobaculaceae bacterium]